MNGFLGTAASFWSDLSLVSVFVLLGIASYGAINAHRRIFSRHCPVMTTAAILNWLPILFVMVPRWFLSAQGDLPGVSGSAQQLPIFHGILGLGTQLLMTYTFTRMNWIKSLWPEKPIWLMRATISLWAITALGGLFIYLALYTTLFFPQSV